MFMVANIVFDLIKQQEKSIKPRRTILIVYAFAFTWAKYDCQLSCSRPAAKR